jgi:hypothetical protein
MNLGHFFFSSRTSPPTEPPVVSRPSGGEFGGIITSSAVTAILDIRFARRDAADALPAAVSTRTTSLLSVCFRAEKSVCDQAKNQ